MYFINNFAFYIALIIIDINVWVKLLKIFKISIKPGIAVIDFSRTPRRFKLGPLIICIFISSNLNKNFIKNQLDWRSAIKGFQAYLKLEKSLSPNSIEAYSRDIDKLYQYSEAQAVKISPEKITLNDLRRFIAWVNELGMIPSTQARILSGIKAF